MMQVAFQNNPREFLSQFGPLLEKNEAEHNLMLSLCWKEEQRARQGEKTDLRCSVLFNEGEFVLAAVQSPPHNLVLSRAAQPEIEKLAESLANQNFSFPGIVGPSDVTSSFANAWMMITGNKSVEYMDQIIYSLTQVSFPPPVEGEFRFAGPDEAETIASWTLSFSRCVLPKAEQRDEAVTLRMVEEKIRNQKVAVWSVGGKPVAQASVGGTSAIARIGCVYTPPEERGHGYASAVVAHLSQHQLDQGKRMCCLYADARNPVSNSIYRKIGYSFVGRSSLYVFDKNPR